MTTSKGYSLPLIGKLRTAIQKVKFLLSFSATRWIFSSSPMGSSASSPLSRRLSIEYSPNQGLLDCVDDDGTLSSGRPKVILRTSSSITSGHVSRTESDALSLSTEEDIDTRAEMFIASFYRHIQMERQVSLELRYCDPGNGLERSQSS